MARRLISPWFKKGCVLGTAVVGTIGISAALATPVFATDLELHCPKLPWNHHRLTHSFDHASLRRGFQVYREVCASCHSMKYVFYRHLVGVICTEETAKAIAAEETIVDGPDDAGEMFTRPRKLIDPLPLPYPNDAAAKAANKGAAPADLSKIIEGREQHEDYIFHLLTGYMDPPAGVEVGEDLTYNPYFPGGSIAMEQSLYDDLIEYEDGTPATKSQMAKDVATFLAWASEPKTTERKKFWLFLFSITTFMFLASWYWKRRLFSSLKTTQLKFKRRPPPRLM